MYRIVKRTETLFAQDATPDAGVQSSAKSYSELLFEVGVTFDAIYFKINVTL